MSQLFLHDELSDISLGTNNTNKAGTAVAWRARVANPVVGDAGNVTATVATVTGPTNGLETGNPVNEWISPPLAAAVTISGTLTFNICGLESSAMANAGLGVVVQRVDNVGTVVSTIADSVQLSELATGNSRRTWTATPTSTAMAKGDRFRIRVYFDDAGGTMATGYTLTLTYDGTNAALGDSNVDFAETLTFMYPTSPTGLFTATHVTNITMIDQATNGTAWLAAGNQGTILWTTTPTGAWTEEPSPMQNVNTVAQQAGTWIQAGRSVGLVAQLYSAADPAGPWTERLAYSGTSTVQMVRFGDGVWVAIVGEGSGGAILTATDPTGTWTKHATALASLPTALTWGGGLWVIVGSGTTYWTATDPTGTWTARTSAVTAMTSIEFGGGVWVGGGDTGLFRSTNPTVSWTAVTGSFTDVNGVSYNASKAAWFANAGTALFTSADTVSWRQVDGVPGEFNIIFSLKSVADVTVLGANDVYTSSQPPTTAFLTAVASSIVDQGTTELSAWTSRGNG